LDERKRLILNAIIQDYIFFAEPVGSRSLVKRHSIGLSPATIRNEMADLEEMGYLEQPHTSAGRIPSHLGYRFYVNSLMEDFSFDSGEVAELEALVSDINRVGGGGFTRQLAKLLASVTNYITLITEPLETIHEIRHIDIIPLSEHVASIIVVLSDGTVNHQSIALPKGIEARQVKALTNFFNKRLRGVRLMDINSALLKELKAEFAGNMKLIDDVVGVVRYLLMARDDQLVIDGTSNLLSQPEFSDINKARELLASLDQNEQLLHLMNINANDLAIKIGSEIGLESFCDCSLVVATFAHRDRKVVLGILGPARMQYAKTIGFMKWLKEYFE
jgi:heat-inducible transcriptional repressor